MKGAIKHIVGATRYSIDGIVATFKTQIAFRLDIALCCVALVSLMFIPVDWFGRAMMALSLVFIVFAELVNTAIEAVIDRIGTEYNRLSKMAKDIGSALVMISILWVAIFWVVMIFAHGY